MSLSAVLTQGALAAVIAGVPTAVGGWFAFRQATRVQRHADRAAFTDDLQEEVAALRAEVAEGRKEVAAGRREADALRYRLRGAMEYMDLCMSTMRRNGMNPPPVPAIVRFPWEEGDA